MINQIAPLSLIVAILVFFTGCGGTFEVSNETARSTKTEPSETDSANHPTAEGETRSNSEVPNDSSQRQGSEEKDKIVYGDQFPEVIAVEALSAESESWRFNVTLSSVYDSPQRYADAWRVLDEQGNELGIRILGHDHASEQPFTRSARIQIPKELSKVFVEGRDQANGWSGQRFEVNLR